MNDGLTVGRLASSCGVSRDTIRYYERLGLLPRAARTPAGYRQFPPTAVNRLVLIRNAQRFGFSLVQIRGFLRVRESGGRPCHEVRAAAARMLLAIDRQIADLRATRTRIRRTLHGWDAALARTPAERPAHLLERLALPESTVRAETRGARPSHRA